MKVSYKEPDSGSYVVLCDETSTSPSAQPGAPISSGMQAVFQPHFKPLVQSDNLAGGLASFSQPRGNISCEFPLQFNSLYSSRQNALDSILTFALLMNSVFASLKVEEGAIAHWYPNAIITDYHADIQGCSVNHSFTFKTDMVEDVEP